MHPPLTHQDMQYQGMNEVSSPRGYHEFSPPIDGSLLGRKRTFSMSEGIHGLPMPQSALTTRSHAPTVGTYISHSTLKVCELIPTGETAANIPESYPLFNVHIAQNKMSGPYWNESQDLTNLPVDSVVGSLSQPASDTTVPYPVDEASLKTYVLNPISFDHILTDLDTMKKSIPYCRSCPIQKTVLWPSSTNATGSSKRSLLRRCMP